VKWTRPSRKLLVAETEEEEVAEEQEVLKEQEEAKKEKDVPMRPSGMLHKSHIIS
jgi:hypothetical protein